MAPNRPGQLGGWIGQGFGAQLLRWGGFGEYPPTAPERGSTGAGRSLGAARGGARNWCPRRALGPMNSAWAKGRGRRAALYRTAAFVIGRVALSQKAPRLIIALRRTAARRPDRRLVATVRGSGGSASTACRCQQCVSAAHARILRPSGGFSGCLCNRPEQVSGLCCKRAAYATIA